MATRNVTKWVGGAVPGAIDAGVWLTPGMADDVVRILARQYGLISRAQALAAGLEPGAIRHRVDSGRWIREAPGVYGIPGHRPSWRRSLWSAYLHAGPASAVAHESAGRLRGFSQVPAGRRVLIVPDVRRHPPPGVVWHRLVDLAPSDVSLQDGLPVTTAARTAMDLASVLSPVVLRLLVEEGVSERRFRLAEVGAVLARVRRKGRRGVRRMERVLDELGPGEAVPRSQLERLGDRVIARAGLPPPIHEAPLPGRGALEGRVDRCWPELRWIVEFDGRRWHERRQQMALDAERDLQALAAGYATSRLFWEHVDGDPGGSAELLVAIACRRRADLGLATGRPSSTS